MTAEERSVKVCIALGLGEQSVSIDAIKAVSMMFKEQDRDTRHACAEAVMQQWVRGEYTHGSDFSAACMNVKAV